MIGEAMGSLYKGFRRAIKRHIMYEFGNWKGDGKQNDG
jgi:hypothetical protein